MTHTFPGPVFSVSIYVQACKTIQESLNEYKNKNVCWTKLRKYTIKIYLNITVQSSGT